MDHLYSADVDYKLDFEWADYLVKNGYLKID